MKPAKLDSTDLHDDTSASSAPTSEACSHAVLACSPGIPEEYYVSEAAEDAPSYRGYRDACTITGTLGREEGLLSSSLGKGCSSRNRSGSVLVTILVAVTVTDQSRWGGKVCFDSQF